MTARRALSALIVVSTVLRLIWAAYLGGFTNEAYYYEYSRHLDWGFFDHPPMVGAIATLGLKLAGGLSPVFGLRVGFVLLFAGSTWLMARLTERLFDPWAGFLAALCLNLTIFHGIKIGTLADPDGPLLFFWLLTLDRLVVALDSQRTTAWIGVGLAFGGALLTKYYAVFLPLGAVLYLLLQPEQRRCLKTPGPYLAAVLGLAVFSPVVAWNAAHSWASFAYQGGRAGGFHGFQFATFFEAVVGQFLYLTPWIWVGLVLVLFGLARRPRSWSAGEAFLVCQALPPLALFMGVATFRRIMPHWPMIGFVPLMPMLGQIMAQRLNARPRQVRRVLIAAAAAPVVFSVLFIAHARAGLFQDAHGRLMGLLPAKADPTLDTIRWEQLARQLARRGLLDQADTFLFTDHWRLSAELAMATDQPGRVACFCRDARSFMFWSQPQDWVGRDGIFVQLPGSPAQPSQYQPWFTRIVPLDDVLISRGGVAMETIHLYRCVHQNAPFPFGYAGPGPIPVPEVPSPLEATPSILAQDDRGTNPATSSPPERTRR